MALIRHNIQKLEEIKNLLNQLPPDLYIHPCEILNQASIGQHFRHILEFYVCLEKGAEEGSICYDDRERNVLIETHVKYAVRTLESLILFLGNITHDHSLSMKANYSATSEEKTTIQTSLFRELAYALDHTIHHLAMVKIALSEAKVQVDNNFGVALSTIRYRNTCAQ